MSNSDTYLGDYTKRRKREVWIKFKNVSEFVWNEYLNNLINKKTATISSKTISPKIKATTPTPTILKSTTPQQFEQVFNNEDEF